MSFVSDGCPQAAVFVSAYRPSACRRTRTTGCFGQSVKNQSLTGANAMSTLDKQGGSNVQGWERALSIGSGIAMARGGLKRGGILGLARAAFGGMLVARGLSGHCRLKSIMEDARSMRPEVDQISDTVSRIEGEIAERVKPVVKKVSDGV